MWLCKYCESVNYSDKDLSCVVCGQYKDTQYDEIHYCSNCGTKYRTNETDRFCIRCGKRLLFQGDEIK